jgi:tRNA dimethylallyltransferase
VGKTGVVEELFAGNGAFRAEIVSADSMQVYKGMDIGTAKPPAGLRERLPHHLIDIRTPDQSYNAGDFVHLAEEAIARIAGRGALPVVSGGTGFYLKNFIMGLPEAPPSDEGARRALKAELREQGVEVLARELAACDPASAARIHINDEYRILRALEVFRLTGKPLSAFAMNAAASRAMRGSDDPRAPRPESAGNRRGAYRFLTLALERPREDLYQRVNERCALMFKNGLADEVRSLTASGYGPICPGMRAIGYREFFNERGDLSASIAGVEALVARHSRNYAKRQMTYFASIPNTVWIRADEKPVEKIQALLNAALLNATSRDAWGQAR